MSICAVRKVAALDNDRSRASRPGGPFRDALDRIGLAATTSRGVVALVAALWFVLALSALFWVWGFDTRLFPSSDEAVVRYAAALIAQGQAPFLNLPLPDPEDLLHPRSWLTIGHVATPSYAPLSFYGYGVLLRLHRLGPLLIAALPASAVAAFAAGTAELLPAPRRWLAIVAPLLGFPALYWLLRPWINLSPLLVGVCWSLFFWSLWRNSDRVGWLAACLSCLAWSAGVRPDYAAYLLFVTLLLSVAAKPAQWKAILALTIASGLLALAANLLLNRAITGHPLTAAYQIALNRQWQPSTPSSMPGVELLRALLLPMGIPSFDVASVAFRKYWLTMGPIGLLLVAQLALVPLLRDGSRLARALRAAALLAIVMFSLSRMHDDLFGGARAVGEVHHSVPRYLAPVYLLAALPPLLFLGKIANRWLFIAGATVSLAFALVAGYDIGVRESSSFTFLRSFQRTRAIQLQALSRRIPADAIVYTAKEDKWIWSRWRVATVDDPEATASSIARASSSNFSVFVLEPASASVIRKLGVALRRRDLWLSRVDARRGLYRVVARPQNR